MQVQEDEGTLTWPRFKELLNLCYGPPLRSAPLFELASCQRMGSVEDYQDRNFQALLPRVGHLDEAQRVHGWSLALAQPADAELKPLITGSRHEPRAPDGALAPILHTHG